MTPKQKRAALRKMTCRNSMLFSGYGDCLRFVQTRIPLTKRNVTPYRCPRCHMWHIKIDGVPYNSKTVIDKLQEPGRQVDFL